MLGKIKQMLGLGGKGGDGPAWYDDQLYAAKLSAFEDRLGKSADEVMAAIIGWGMGGPVDLWLFPNHDQGTYFTTMQLAVPGDSNGQLRNSMGRFELAAATRRAIERSPEPEEDEEPEDREHTPFEQQMFDIRAMLSTIAYYSFDAVLEPNETAELPAEDDADTVYLVMASLAGPDNPVRVQDEDIGIMMCIRVHKSELDFARENGTTKLIERLKAAGHYPYSDLDREPVA